MNLRGKAGNGPLPPIVKPLPVIAVGSRREMARLLHTWGWLLRDTARAHLGNVSEATEAADTVMSRLLAEEHPNYPHGLRRALQLIHRECYRIQREQRRQPTAAQLSREQGVPYDDVLDRPIVGDLAEAVDRLPGEQRRVFMLAAKGVRPADIARALGKQPRTVGMLLFRARRHLRSTLLGVLALWQRPWDRLRRYALGRSGPASEAVGGLSTQLASAAALALMTLTAGSVPLTAPPPAVASPLPMSQADVAAGATPSAPAPRTPQTSGATATASSGQPPVQLAAGLPRTPEQTRLVAITAAPDYRHNHTVVALGEGPQCHCLVLFQSTDGAATWQAAPGPPGGAQVVLPPDYPRDPRIFIGNPAGLAVSGSTDYVAERFDGAYDPLPAPPGLLALSGAFDDGDPRLYVASTVGVVAVDLSSGAPTVGAVSTGAWGAPGLATVPGMAGVLALVPPDSLNVGTQPLRPPAAASSAVLGCRLALCSHLADTGSTTARALTVSATYGTDQLVAAWGGSTLALLRDGGHWLQPLPLPSGSGAVRSVGMEAGRLWLEVVDVAARVHMYWTALGTASWHAVSVPGALLSVSTSVVALGANRLVLLTPGLGFRCTTDMGSTWLTACPPA